MPPNLRRLVGPVGDIEHLAVYASRGQSGMHAGIVYRDEDSLKLLHQAFHLDLRKDDFTKRKPRDVCVLPCLLRDDLVALAGYCRRIYLVNSVGGGIPYNLEFEPGTDFDPETGDLVLQENGAGMTCATFVLHVFRSSGNPIIDVTGWPQASERPGDLERQRELVHMLETGPDPIYRKQAERIRHQIGCPRIRPEDVAGACLEDELPATFACCDPNGRLILTIIDTQQEMFL